MGMIIRVAFNNRNWNGKCINADKRDRRLYKCWSKVVKTGYKIDKKGKCKANCAESSLCKNYKWYSFHGDFDISRANGKVYFVYPDIDNSLVLWAKSKIKKLDGDTIEFDKFKPLPEKKWLRNLNAKDILGVNWKSHPYRYIEKDIENLLDKLIKNSDTTFNDIAEIDISSKEGKNKLVKHLIKERSTTLVISFKKSLKSYECKICGFDFERKYGAIGKGFIEAHHITPIYSLKGVTNVSISNLLAVCSNCHRMIHRTKNMANWKTLKNKFK